jgi:hypothetical protein
VATDARLVAKLEWLKDYVWRSMEALADFQIRIGVNAGTRFASVFPRGEENLMSYVAQMKRERKRGTTRAEMKGRGN